MSVEPFLSPPYFNSLLDNRILTEIVMRSLHIQRRRKERKSGGANFVLAQGPTAPLDGGRGGGTISCDLSLERESHAQS